VYFILTNPDKYLSKNSFWQTFISYFTALWLFCWFWLYANFTLDFHQQKYFPFYFTFLQLPPCLSS
jgi:hypothetical protein